MTMTNTLPAQAFLSDLIGQSFLLTDEAGNVTQVILQSVEDGTPMDETYVCYRILLLCPPGVQAAQANYQLSYLDRSWLIFMSPTNPDKNGQMRLQASFHFAADQVETE